MNKKLKQKIYDCVFKCLNESFLNNIEITFDKKNFEDETHITINGNGDEMGYAILIYHHNIESLYSEIADTDSYEMAEDVVYKLNINKPIIEIANLDVNKNYRNKGISKNILEYILENYQEYQFYLRICPTDGVDEYTFANMFKRYGFIEIDSSENGTFMIKK